MGTPAISRWFAKEKVGGSNVDVRRFISINTSAPPPLGREWHLWTGWDENLALNGRAPRLVCVMFGGSGVTLLSPGEKLPERPFGASIPKGGRWQTNPNLPSVSGSRLLGKKVSEWEACHTFSRLARELSRNPSSVRPADCTSFGISGLDALLRSEGFSPRILMKMQTSPRQLLIAYYSTKNSLRLVHVNDRGVADVLESADAEIAELLFGALKANTPQ